MSLIRFIYRMRFFALLAGAVLLLTGGCPVDTDDLTANVLQAALQSISDSLVEAVSTYLAGN
ncbi:MAG: hypothetical protein ABIG44_11565 [Planctomycetota bacterium]